MSWHMPNTLWVTSTFVWVGFHAAAWVRWSVLVVACRGRHKTEVLGVWLSTTEGIRCTGNSNRECCKYIDFVVSFCFTLMSGLMHSTPNDCRRMLCLLSWVGSRSMLMHRCGQLRSLPVLSSTSKWKQLPPFSWFQPKLGISLPIIYCPCCIGHDCEVYVMVFYNLMSLRVENVVFDTRYVCICATNCYWAYCRGRLHTSQSHWTGKVLTMCCGCLWKDAYCRMGVRSGPVHVYACVVVEDCCCILEGEEQMECCQRI